MAKLHSALTNAELHNPKGITSESTGSILVLNQSTSKITEVLILYHHQQKLTI